MDAGNSGDVKGVKKCVVDMVEDMEQFDMLPSDIRKALNYADFEYSAINTMEIYNDLRSYVVFPDAVKARIRRIITTQDTVNREKLDYSGNWKQRNYYNEENRLETS